MATITPVNDGDIANDDWPDAVTSEVNRYQTAVLTGDVSKAASSYSDITGLTAAVVNGRAYAIEGCIIWAQSSTSGGIRVSSNNPGGNVRLMASYTGETGPEAFVHNWQTTTDDAASGVSTADLADTPRLVDIRGRYICTSDGTFALRYFRVSAGTLTIQEGSWLRLTEED